MPDRSISLQSSAELLIVCADHRKISAGPPRSTWSPNRPKRKIFSASHWIFPSSLLPHCRWTLSQLLHLCEPSPWGRQCFFPHRLHLGTISMRKKSRILRPSFMFTPKTCLHCSLTTLSTPSRIHLNDGSTLYIHYRLDISFSNHRGGSYPNSLQCAFSSNQFR